MATTSVQLDVGYGESDRVAITAVVADGPPGLSGLYVKVFAPTDTQTGQPLLVETSTCPVPLRVERRYELPPGSMLRVELDATAGSSGAPVSLSASTPYGPAADASGLTNETIAVEVPAHA